MSDIIVNKVIKGDETYLDLTNDTVSEGALLKNRTAHNSEGIQIQGTMEEGGGSVTGVKGDDESVYRDGDVNITAANIGTYTTSQIDALLNNKVDVHGTDSLMTNAEHVKLAGIEAGAEENVIESISLNGEEITPVNKAVALSVIDKDVDDLTNYYKKSETDASLGAKQNIILSSTLSIGGQTVTEVEEALESLANISKPMTGATSSAAGEGGFVPSPSAGDENKALFGDGTWKPVSGGGGGGHTILDEDGTTYPQRSKLQFEGCEVTDDSTNDITKIKAEGGVTGVKGNAETDYRTGNVNLTPAHVGAVDEVEYEEDIYGINLIQFPYYHTTRTHRGVTFTVNSDGSVTANGTATDGLASIWLTYYHNEQFYKENSFIFSGCPDGGSVDPTLENPGYFMNYYVETEDGVYVRDYYDTGDGVYCPPLPNGQMFRLYIGVQKGCTVSNLTFRPMLRKATIQDDTYRPYNQQSIQNQLTEQTNVLGAKNLFKVTAISQTRDGVTFTVNTDSKGNVLNVTANGTAADGRFGLGQIELEPGVYFLNGAPKSPALYDWRLRLVLPNDSAVIAWDDGEGATFTVNTKATYDLQIRYAANASFSNTVFKPMIIPASVRDHTYVPYAMTNRELTEVKVSEITSIISNNNYSKGTLRCWYKKIGKLVELFIQIKCIATTDTWINILNYSTIPKPALVGNYPIYFDIPAAGGTTQYPIVAVLGSSNLQVRKGTPEYYYHLHTTYISE